jgi:O-antigen/teichoic acid export membrane protein
VSPASRVRQNSFFSLISSAIRLSSSFLLFVGIARLYGPEAFGQYTTAHALSTLFLILADLGLDTLLALEVARQQESAAAVLRRYAAIKVTVAVAASLTMVGIGALQPLPDGTSLLIVILGASVVFSALMNFEFALLRGVEQLHHEAGITAFINAAALVLLILAGLVHAPLSVVALIYALTRVAGYLLARRRTRRVLGVSRIGLTFEGWAAVRGKAALFAAYLLFGYLVFQLDTLLLAALRGPADVGTYQAVFKVVVVALVIPDVVASATMPTLSRLHRESPEEWLRLGERLGRWLLLASLPVALVMVAYPGAILTILYGPDTFPEAVPVMRIFGGVVFIRFAAETFGLLLTTSEHQHLRVWVLGVATAVNAAANLALIPGQGPRGAAVISLATNAGIAAAYVLMVRRRYRPAGPDARLVTTALATAAIAAVSLAVPPASTWVALPVAVGTSLLVAYFVGLREEERATLFAFATRFREGRR